MGFYGGLMGFNMVNIQQAIEYMAIKIVDLMGFYGGLMWFNGI